MAKQSKRRSSRLRNGITRRLEILEARTLLNASIDIDADGLLTYKTDREWGDWLNISVAGDVYTFASTVDIDVATNDADLSVTGDGGDVVTVAGINGLAVDVGRPSQNVYHRVNIASSTVATAIRLDTRYGSVTFGDPNNPAGLRAISAPITVTDLGASATNRLTLDDSGSTALASYTLTATTLTADNGFGGLTYSGVKNLRLNGSTGANEFIVQGTGDDMTTDLVGNWSQSNHFIIEGTSADSRSEIFLRGGPGLNTFDFKAISSVARPITGDGTNFVNLGNAGDASGIAGAIWLDADRGEVHIAVDDSAGTTGKDWLLAKYDDAPGAVLTGFGPNGELDYTTDQLSSLSLAAATGQANSLGINLFLGDTLPWAPGRGRLSYNGGGGDSSGSGIGLFLAYGEFDAETHDALSPSSGRIALEDDGLSWTISYDGLNPRGVFDVLGATDYTFNNLGDSTIPVDIKKSDLPYPFSSFQTLSISAPGAFADTHVAWKRHITINANSSAVDGSVTVDYPSAPDLRPVLGLETLTIAAGDGEGAARLLNLPPVAVTNLQQGAGDDSAIISVAGLDQTRGATLDGGEGVNTLTIDAGGRPLWPARFTAGPGGSTVVNVPIQGGPITYSNYQQVSLINLSPPPISVTGQTIYAIQGKDIVSGVAARFFSSAPDAKPGDFDATIDWGDGASSVGVIVQDAINPSIFYVTGSHAYAETATRYFTTVAVAPVESSLTEFTQVINGVPVTFAARVGGAASAPGWVEVIITDLPARPPVVNGRDITAVQGRRLDDAVVATFTSDAPGAKASDFDATIDWGDGSPGGVGSITQDPDESTVFYVIGTHAYYESAASLTTTITVTSSGSTFTDLIDGVPVDFHTPPSGPVVDFGMARVIAAPATVTVNSFTDVEYPAPGLTEVVLATFGQPGGFNPADPNPAARYVVEVNWGDAAGAETIPIENVVYDKTTDVFTIIVPRRAYTRPGSYNVSVAVGERLKDGSKGTILATASGVAHIVDAPLSATSPQPAIPAVFEGAPMVDQIIGAFTDANPLGLVGEFTAMIDWGDGSPLSPGKVIQPGGLGAPFLVVGSHAYASARPATDPPTGQTPAPGPVTADGTYPIRIHVQSVHGSTVEPSNTIRVVDRPILLAGVLNPASDSGVSNADAITNVVQPNFLGAASEPGAVVFLYATPQGGAPVLIGQATVALNGAWSITPGAALPNGAYAIQAQAYDASGHSISALTTIAPNLVIDTVGPRIADARLAYFNGRAIVVFEDFGGVSNAGTGLVHATLVDANNYQFSMLRPPLRGLRVGPRWPVTAVGVQPGTSVGPQAATIRINNGRPIRPGRYLLGVAAATLDNPLGVRDVAGNALEGQIQWPLTPANRVPIRPVWFPRRPGGPMALRLATMRG